MTAPSDPPDPTWVCGTYGCGRTDVLAYMLPYEIYLAGRTYAAGDPICWCPPHDGHDPAFVPWQPSQEEPSEEGGAP